MNSSVRATPSISFVVTAKEGYLPVAAQLALLQSAQRAGSEVILLTGADCTADAKALADLGIRFVELPGASIFGLRSHIPAVCRKDWVFLVEDHAIVDRGVVDALYDLIEKQPEIDLIVVPAKNLTSVTAWDWANFIHTFAFAWAPIDGRPVETRATNVVVRRARLGTDAPLEEGEWEFRLIPRIFSEGKIACSNEIFVDHIKHVNLGFAFALNFHNGRACAAIAGAPRGSMSGVVRKGWRAFVGRHRQMQAKIAGRKHELPTGLTWRLYVIGLAHLLGTVLGTRFGGGKSIQSLD